MNLSKNGYSYIFPYSYIEWKKLVIEVREDKCYKNLEEKNDMKLIYETLINDIQSTFNKLPLLPELLWYYEVNYIFEKGVIGVLWHDIILNEDYFFENEKRIKNFLFNIIHSGSFNSEDEKDKWKILYVGYCLIKIYHLTKDGKFDEIKKDYDKIKELLKICDNGLIIGYDLGKKYLAECANFLHNFLPIPPEYKENINKEILLPKEESNTITIPTINVEDEETFLIEYFLKSKPVIIKEYVNKWNAFNKWNHKFFYQSFYYRSIPVEYGESYISSDYNSKVITFGEYLKTTNNTGYLAQHNIFHQIPKLKDDIMITSLIFCDSITSDYSDVDMNIFLGKPKSYSPLHQDPRHNFFCQINGMKFVRLISNKYDKTKQLYCFDDDTTNKNSSKVNIFNIDKKLYPNISDVVFEDYLMKPGDCLFIPRGYFHAMYGLTNNISLSQWFGDTLF
ncbi:Lysine-specific demethylase 8 [Strongyloides ratti]|uniref:Lysine-specific demethylase 8 n=1 Tax=Strongyloides ratti TaxID=34506 RepID=A0A090LH81_STRRB|nr:Lysine-specific demethylase 8 [Strongyloides ratti]CEF69151.1 Lysine-specific demethylase 8 [Strongyloides ratti]